MSDKCDVCGQSKAFVSMLRSRVTACRVCYESCVCEVAVMVKFKKNLRLAAEALLFPPRTGTADMGISHGMPASHDHGIRLQYVPEVSDPATVPPFIVGGTVT